METIAGNYVNLIRRADTMFATVRFTLKNHRPVPFFRKPRALLLRLRGWRRCHYVGSPHGQSEFTDAVKQLAERCGLQVPTDREADRRAYLRTRVFAVNRKLQISLFRNLISGSDKRGLQYFISRQLKPETIKKYGLGYASDSWNALTDYLLQKGFTEEELLLANVAKVSEHGKNTGVRQGQ